MTKEEIICTYWSDIDKQNWNNLATYFTAEATISWPNTTELLTVDDFVNVNRYYPGNWTIEVLRLFSCGDNHCSITRVSSQSASYHALSFFSFQTNLISNLEEYWSEDAPPPSWRANKYLRKDD